jgi:hypothetical protein
MKKRSDLDDEMQAMARNSYAYGTWRAPYWFIGPEQGMGRHERDDFECALKVRVAAWIKLGRLDLNDCRKFHCEIGEKNWHCKKPVNLQMTWRPLLLLLMAFLKREAEKETLRTYQRDRWGMLDGETCVIELSGIAAPNQQEATDTSRFLPERIELIRQRIRDHQPKLVVMYGHEQRESFEKIAGRPFPPEPDPVLSDGPTTLAFTFHPVSRICERGKYLGNQYWTRMGKKLRDR